MANLSEADLEIIKKNADTLRSLTDAQIIMLVLEQLLLEADKLPPGSRFPLMGECRRRSGLRQP